MRRVIFVAVLLLLGVLLWRMPPGGLHFGGSPAGGPDADAGLPAAGTGPATELRIEINEAAPEAEAGYRETLRRWGNDPNARAWVAECLAQSAAGEQDPQQFADSWEHACWQSWRSRQEVAQP